jgi:hypothetical protein
MVAGTAGCGRGVRKDRYQNQRKILHIRLAWRVGVLRKARKKTIKQKAEIVFCLLTLGPGLF